MKIVDIFESFAADFEATVQDDNWSRLEKYFVKDATYLNVGEPDSQCNGCAAILAYLKQDVADFDRRFDTRTLVALTPPIADGNNLSRRWRCTYTLDGSPDLVVEGEARYLFENDLIKKIEEEPTASSIQEVNEWIQKFGDRLPAGEANQ
jgi:hypothetical protein